MPQTMINHPICWSNICATPLLFCLFTIITLPHRSLFFHPPFLFPLPFLLLLNLLHINLLTIIRQQPIIRRVRLTSRLKNWSHSLLSDISSSMIIVRIFQSFLAPFFSSLFTYSQISRTQVFIRKIFLISSFFFVI